MPAIGRYHPFDGDGMVHAIRFADGRASYRNRFVRTQGLAAELEAGAPLWAGIIEPPAKSQRDGWGARGRMKDASSTDVVVHDGRALTTFYQCGDVYQLDPRRSRDRGRAPWVPAGRRVGAPEARSGDRRAACSSATGPTAPYMHYGVARCARRARPLPAGPAARSAAAARHGVHRALRDPQRLPAVLGSRAAREGRVSPALAARSAVAVRASCRAAAATCAGSRPRRRTCCTSSTRTRTATRSSSTATSRTIRCRARSADGPYAGSRRWSTCTR